jgi:hypothetical protein
MKNKKQRAKIAKRIVGDKTPAKWQGLDDVFLHRSQVNIGSELLYYGRLDHGSVWRVVEIKTFSKGGRAYKIDYIKTMRDVVVLLRRGSNETRQVSFAQLSYCAIWRLFK